MLLNVLSQYGLQHRRAGVGAPRGSASCVGHSSVGHRADLLYSAAAGHRLVRRALFAEHRQIRLCRELRYAKERARACVYFM